MSEEFVGRGWSFPLRTAPDGAIALVERSREVEESLRLILSTVPGERPMRPDFGCAIHHFMFAPIDATTEGRIASEVRASIARWEPRVDVLDVSVERATGSDSTLLVDIGYCIRGSNDPRNLVFPFYVIPGE